MPAYGRLLHDFCEKLGVEGGDPGRQLDGRLHRGRGGDGGARSASTRLVLVSAAGIINTWNPEERAIATAWAWKTFGPHRRRPRPLRSSPARAPREVVFRPFVRYPDRLRDDLLWSRSSAGCSCADGFGDALQALIRHDIRERLGEIEMPTMIVWGQSDRVIPMAAALSYHRRIPHSRLEIFERTGHVPQLERPARFNALLDEFLAE